MRTIPAAMTWELLARGRWTLLGAAVGMIALPMLVFSSLSSVGALDPQDQSVRMLHFLFMQANIFTLIACMIGMSVERASRLFTTPARSATLVTWQLIPAAGVMAFDVLAWTALHNVAFEFDWPLWGPALLAVGALVSAQAALWLCFRSAWMILPLTLLAGVCSYWFKSHYGDLFGELNHAWRPVTLLEIVALAILSSFAFGLAVLGFARSRRGEAPVSLGLIAWMTRQDDARPGSGRSFRSPLQAQGWCFRQRAWTAPIAVSGVIAMSVTIWVSFNRNPRDLILGFVFSCGYVWIAALLGGILLGAVGSKGDVQMGQFLATRPIANAALARILLRVAAESLLITWLIWGVTLLLLLFGVRLTGHQPLALLPTEFKWQMLTGGVLASWVALTSIMSIVLVGRGQLVTRILALASFALIALIIFSKHTLEPATHAFLMQTLVALFGVACSAVTALLFVSAWRRGMIASRTLGVSVAAWLALIVVTALAIPADAAIPLPGAMLLFGSLALAVAPIAAVPLALAWNRTR